jgi:hypothetical protein
MASRVLMTISRQEEHARYMSRFKYEIGTYCGFRGTFAQPYCECASGLRFSMRLDVSGILTKSCGAWFCECIVLLPKRYQFKICGNQ